MTEPAAKKGHPIAFWYFFWGEFAERCAYYGVRVILSKYMTDRLGFSQADAGTYGSVFLGFCYILPMLGGWLADNFFGKYWTIVGFSIPYVVSMVTLGIEDRTTVAVSLAMLAMGSGVIKPNISTLMGLTYDQQRPGDARLRSDAFSWFYFSINIGAFISQTTVPILRTNFGYFSAFLFPAGLMAAALCIFAAGKRLYAKETVGSAARKESEPEPVDRIAVITKVLILFAPVMFFWAIFDQSSSTWVFFGECLDLHLFGKKFAADGVQNYNALFIVIMLPLMTFGFKKAADAGWRIRATDKMIAGFLLTSLCMWTMAAAGFLSRPEQRPQLKPVPAAVARTIEVKDGVLTVEKVAWDSEAKKLKKPESTSGKVAASGAKVLMDREKEKPKDVTEYFVVTDGAAALKLKERSRTQDPLHAEMEDAALTAMLRDGTEIQGIPKLNEKRTQVTIDVDGKPLDITDMFVDNEKKGEERQVQTEWFAPPDRKVTVWVEVLAYFIITIAEILISVTGLELAYVIAPKSMQGVVTGCWLLAVGMGNIVINAPVTRLYPVLAPGVYFSILASTLIAVAVVFHFIAREFNKPKPEAAA